MTKISTKILMIASLMLACSPLTTISCFASEEVVEKEKVSVKSGMKYLDELNTKLMGKSESQEINEIIQDMQLSLLGLKPGTELVVVPDDEVEETQKQLSVIFFTIAKKGGQGFASNLFKAIGDKQLGIVQQEQCKSMLVFAGFWDNKLGEGNAILENSVAAAAVVKSWDDFLKIEDEKKFPQYASFKESIKKDFALPEAVLDLIKSPLMTVEKLWDVFGSLGDVWTAAVKNVIDGNENIRYWDTGQITHARNHEKNERVDFESAKPGYVKRYWNAINQSRQAIKSFVSRYKKYDSDFKEPPRTAAEIITEYESTGHKMFGNDCAAHTIAKIKANEPSWYYSTQYAGWGDIKNEIVDKTSVSKQLEVFFKKPSGDNFESLRKLFHKI